MGYIKSFFILCIIIPTIVVSQSFQSSNGIESNSKNFKINSSNDWIPLVQGSIWVFSSYANIYSPYGPSVQVFIGTSKMFYEKDTIINNQTYAKITHNVLSAQTNHFSQPLLIRKDTITNKYYKYSSPSEKLFFDPLADSGTVIPDFFVLGQKSTRNIFGEVRESWNINPIVGGYGNIILVRGIGLFYSKFDEFGGYFDSLKGCVIGGQLFGDTTFVTSVKDEIIPDNFVLYQNFPNPFNSQTTIRFDLPEMQQVQLKIFNSIGEEIYSENLGVMDRGSYSFKFNANNFSSGVYFYQIVSNKFTSTRKMILIK
ncbi:MAG: T9SS type A sorting domain-containing protein [Ignavibacteria bacterium]|jgi:hypothetical protein|nr:T9SS type A sorting domain-containing protein [Ignavibacteria bacterium]MDH7527883.1 T9SS type A sorting domain-containing protein [Ignavibacteria bacterium]